MFKRNPSLNISSKNYDKEKLWSYNQIFNLLHKRCSNLLVLTLRKLKPKKHTFPLATSFKKFPKEKNEKKTLVNIGLGWAPFLLATPSPEIIKKPVNLKRKMLHIKNHFLVISHHVLKLYTNSLFVDYIIGLTNYIILCKIIYILLPGVMFPLFKQPN